MARTLALLFPCLGFWAASAAYQARQPEGCAALRFAAGLALGAVLAHLGWAALHAHRVPSAPLLGARLPVAGFCALFVPLGPLLVAPRRCRPRARARFLAAAFGALPLGLAVARLGCVFAGCCGGVAGRPVRAGEIAGLLGLHVLVSRARPGLAAPLVMGGLGALRLALEPWRAPPPLGPPLVPVAWLAGGWLAAGIALAARQLASCPSSRCAAPNSASGAGSSGAGA